MKHKKNKFNEVIEDVEEFVEEVFNFLTGEEGEITMPATVTVQDNATPPNNIPGVVSVNPNTNAVVFSPSGTLPPSATITMSLSAGVKGVNGLAIAPVADQFTTQPADTAPVVTQEIPANNATNVPLTQEIQIVFDKPIDPTTVSLT